MIPKPLHGEQLLRKFKRNLGNASKILGLHGQFTTNFMTCSNLLFQTSCLLITDRSMMS